MKLKLRTKLAGWLLSTFVLMLALVLALGGLSIYVITNINNVLTDPYMPAPVPELISLQALMVHIGIIIIFMTVGALLTFLALSFVIRKSILKPFYGIVHTIYALARMDLTVAIVKTENGEIGDIQNALISICDNIKKAQSALQATYDSLEKNIAGIKNATCKVDMSIGNLQAASEELGSVVKTLANSESSSTSSCQGMVHVSNIYHRQW